MTQPEFAPPPRFGSHPQFATDHAPQQLGAKPGRLFAIVALVLAGTRSLLEGRTVPLSEVSADDGVPSWQQAAAVGA